eukprot:TRINITY_DN14912_c0_g1_i3.p1 TRINITY_DN14912_c0_g1~~TRINITY_DN14912_c0_g1_i3.p1  ORF type:complete len:150 (-),score=32.41 TRINITY_DN14912_c0_g1_i3:184-633(-)
MADRSFTLVHYYIPEDMDNLDILNAFGIKKAIQDIRVGDVYSSFPLEGQYHFRFKCKHGSEFVWMDILKPDSKPPIVDGKIVVKASRKTWEGKTKVQATSHPEQNVPTKKPYNFNELLEDFDSPAVSSAKIETKKPPAPTLNVSEDVKF